MISACCIVACPRPTLLFPPSLFRGPARPTRVKWPKNGPFFASVASRREKGGGEEMAAMGRSRKKDILFLGDHRQSRNFRQLRKMCRFWRSVLGGFTPPPLNEVNGIVCVYGQKCLTMEFSLRGKTSFAVICGEGEKWKSVAGGEELKGIEKNPGEQNGFAKRGGGVVLKKREQHLLLFPNVLRVRKGLLFFTTAREKLESGKGKWDFETQIQESHRKEISEVFDLEAKGSGCWVWSEGGGISK